jgi:hypothetical protein
MMKVASLLLAIGLILGVQSAKASAVDYSKRLQALDPAALNRLIGKWTNPVDHVVIEIISVDPASGRFIGKEWPTTGQAAGNEHALFSLAGHRLSVESHFDLSRSVDEAPLGPQLMSEGWRTRITRR